MMAGRRLLLRERVEAAGVANGLSPGSGDGAGVMAGLPSMSSRGTPSSAVRTLWCAPTPPMDACLARPDGHKRLALRVISLTSVLPPLEVIVD